MATDVLGDIATSGTVYLNASAPELVELLVTRSEGKLARSGAVVAIAP